MIKFCLAERSLLIKRTNRGRDETEPWGTPVLIFLEVDLYSLQSDLIRAPRQESFRPLKQRRVIYERKHL